MKIIKNYGIWLWMIVLFFLSSIPEEELPEVGFDYFDKLVHLLIYLVLGVLAGYRFGNNVEDTKQTGWRTAFMLGVLYAVFDEIHQLFVPGRMFDIWDIFFDVLGVFAGILIVKSGMNRKQ